MSTPTRYQRWSTPIMLERLGYTEQPEPDPDPEDPTDYAAATEAGAIQVALALGEVVLVNNHRQVGVTGDASWSGTFTPTVNNVLLVFAFQRNGGVYAAPTGWTLIEDVGPSSPSGGAVSIMVYAKVSDGTETGMTYAPGNATARDFVIMEISGVTLDDVAVNNNSGSTTSITTGSVTPPSGLPGIIIGASAATPDEILGQSHTPGGDYTELYDSTGTAAPFEHVEYQIEASTSGSYNPDSTINSLAVGHTWRGLTVALVKSSAAAWTPAPAVNDGDDATYDESDAEIDDASLRVALEVERLIYRAELRIACETAGSKTYDLYGSDDAAFTSPVQLDSQTFTATGSFTPDEVVFSWTAAATYQYFEIRGTDETRRFHDLNLFSQTDVPSGVSDHGDLTGLTDQDHPATAIPITDAAGWFTGTNVETGMAELAAKTIGYQAHGSMGAAETFDAATGWHSGTLDANCTFTLTAAPTGTVSSLFLELTQDSGGGNTITLPASVANKADIESGQDTTASGTTFLVLLSRDGGTTWYGGWWGTSAGGGSIAIDDGVTTVDPATDVTFSGAGIASVEVTDDGGGAATVTVTATAPDPVDDTHAWMPLTTVVAGEPVLVWDDDDNLIPTLTPI